MRVDDDDDTDSRESQDVCTSAGSSLQLPLMLSDTDEETAPISQEVIQPVVRRINHHSPIVEESVCVSTSTHTHNPGDATDGGVVAGNTRGSRWCFTLNNPHTNELIFPSSVLYAIWSRERGAEGTEHLQGYIRTNRLQFKTVTGFFAGLAHVEPAKGSEQANIDYCSKSDTHIAGPWTIGQPAAPGARTDLQRVAAEILKTGTIASVVATNPELLIKYPRGLTALASTVPPPKRDRVLRLLLLGPTNIGKSYNVWELFPNAATALDGNGGLWFPNYTDQRVILLDEFRGQIPLRKFLNLCDRYPTYLENKGGSVVARHNLLIVTSNSPVHSWYLNQDNYRSAEIAALSRRFDHNEDPDSYTIHVQESELVDGRNLPRLNEVMRKEVSDQMAIWYNTIWLPYINSK